MRCCKSVADGFRLLYLMLQVTLTEGFTLKAQNLLPQYFKVLADSLDTAHKTRKPLGGFGQFLAANLVSKTYLG